MTDSMWVILFLPGLFLCVLIFVEIGRRLGTRRDEEETERERHVRSILENAIFALLGVMTAFTYAGAASRFDTRRTLTVQEANAVGTAYLRLDVLPAAAQPALRELFRQYAAARLARYQVLPDVDASEVQAARALALQGEIWKNSITTLKDAEPAASLLVLPALNEMIDITSTRAIMLKTHTPPVALAVLFVITLVCSMLIGSDLARKRTRGLPLHTLGFALALTVTIYVIIDLDHPRFGLIQLDYVDQALSDVLAGMK
ncbi:MAG: hypothetical protein HONDAALG_03999 [Gammaproteobacteria bacterium]|nr:hypothetical protein [Gammaproteobacteria bacterium]